MAHFRLSDRYLELDIRVRRVACRTYSATLSGAKDLVDKSLFRTRSVGKVSFELDDRGSERALVSKLCPQIDTASKR